MDAGAAIPRAPGDTWSSLIQASAEGEVVGRAPCCAQRKHQKTASKSNASQALGLEVITRRPQLPQPLLAVASSWDTSAGTSAIRSLPPGETKLLKRPQFGGSVAAASPCFFVSLLLKEPLSLPEIKPAAKISQSPKRPSSNGLTPGVLEPPWPQLPSRLACALTVATGLT